MPYNYHYTETGANLIIEDLTIEEAFCDFKADVCFDYIPVGSALEKLSTLFDVLSFQYDCEQITPDEVSVKMEQCNNLLQLKLDKAKAGNLTRLPQ